MTIEARALLGASRKRTVHMVQPAPQQGLEMELPADMTKRIRSFEESSFVTTAGPRSTISALELTLHSQAEKSKWCSQARVNAIIGSCSRSLPSVKSGCRCYFAFAQRVLGKTQAQALPPTLDELLAWSGVFRCAETFSNYLSYVKVGTLLKGGCVTVFENDALRRAKRSIKNRAGFKRRDRMFIQLDTVRRIVVECNLPWDEHWGMLYLFAYVFLLRLPSEALPVVRGCIGFAHKDEQASVFMDGEHLCLKLKRRKNKAGGSLLKRACWCRQCKVTCPVHVLWPFFQQFEVGQAAFPGIKAGAALKQLKDVLQFLGLENFGSYRCHDLRRGHAKDMQLNGATLYEILAAGEWRSPAFLDYMSLMELEMGAVIEAHQAESSSEDEE
jgi:hypothetical protein